MTQHTQPEINDLLHDLVRAARILHMVRSISTANDEGREIMLHAAEHLNEQIEVELECYWLSARKVAA